jgi:hypothetical protein
MKWKRMLFNLIQIVCFCVLIDWHSPAHLSAGYQRSPWEIWLKQGGTDKTFTSSAAFKLVLHDDDLFLCHRQYIIVAVDSVIKKHVTSSTATIKTRLIRRTISLLWIQWHFSVIDFMIKFLLEKMSVARLVKRNNRL